MDYVITNKKHIISDITVSNKEVDSDHRLVIARVELNIKLER